ncbi:hypothetical protein [Kitasatospora sp. NPDC090091]
MPSPAAPWTHIIARAAIVSARFSWATSSARVETTCAPGRST